MLENNFFGSLHKEGNKEWCDFSIHLNKLAVAINVCGATGGMCHLCHKITFH